MVPQLLEAKELVHLSSLSKESMTCTESVTSRSMTHDIDPCQKFRIFISGLFL